jgi:transposase-like protein
MAKHFFAVGGDTACEKVRVAGTVVSYALLVAAGITPEGRRAILGLRVLLSEAEVRWHTLLAQLQDLGLCGCLSVTVTPDAAAYTKCICREPLGNRICRISYELSREEYARLPTTGPVASGRQCAAFRTLFNAPNWMEAESLLELRVTKYTKPATKLPCAAWPLRC